MTAYAEAEAARRAGNLELASNLYRQVLDCRPTHAKARKRLIHVLSRQGSRLKTTAPDEALEFFREAWRVDPSLRRLRSKYRKALHGRLASLMLANDREAFTALADRGRLEDCSSQSHTDPLVTPAIAELEKQMPLAPLRELVDGSVAGSWIVLLDSAVNVQLLPAFLRGAGDVEIYTWGRRLGRTELGAHAGPLSRSGEMGLQGHSRLVEVNEEISVGLEQLVHALRTGLPDHLAFSRGLDVVSHLSFVVEDVFVQAAKDLLGLKDVLETRDYSALVLVAGEGVLREAISAVHEAQPIEHPIWELHCSNVTDRYDTVPRRVNLDEPPPLMTDDNREERSEYVKRKAELAKRRVRRGGIPSRVRMVARHLRLNQPIKCALFAAPDRQRVETVVAVASRLSPDAEVIAVPWMSVDDPAYMPYEELMADRGNTRIVDAACCVEEPAPVDMSAVAGAVKQAEPILGELVFGGIRMGGVARSRLRHRLSKHVPNVAKLAECLDDFLRTELPDVVVVSPDKQPSGRAMCSLARARGVATVGPQVSLINYSPWNKPIQADKVYVFDEYQRRIFEKHYVTSPDQVVVTGIPRFDRIVTRREAGLPDPPGDGSTLLVLQVLGIEYHRNLIELMIESVGAGGGCLRVKLHPSDTKEQSTKIRTMLEAQTTVPTSMHWKEDVHDLIVASDLVVSTFSNVVVEAAMLDRPVICGNLSGEPLPLPFVEQGVAFGADGPDELRASVARAVRDPEFRDEIRKGTSGYFTANPHLLEGRAGDRVATLIESMAAGSRRRASLIQIPFLRRNSSQTSRTS